jgi:hypothetical protein
VKSHRLRLRHEYRLIEDGPRPRAGLRFKHSYSAISEKAWLGPHLRSSNDPPFYRGGFREQVRTEPGPSYLTFSPQAAE